MRPLRTLVSLLTLQLALLGNAYAQPAPSPDILLRGNNEDNGFGSSVALAGDVNADGIADLVIGAEAFDDVAVAQGRVFLFYGPLGSSVSFTQADATLTGEALLDGFGNSVAGVGDVNGDGFDDILVGARSNDTVGIQAGRAYLFYGPLSGDRPALTADAIVSGNAFDELGWSVARAGDVNADGFDDLLIGAWMAGNGKAVLFHGPLVGMHSITDAAASIEGIEFNEQVGESVAAVDLTGDGVNDLVIGAPRPPVNGQGTGRVYVFFSPLTGAHSAADADVIITGEQLNDEFGTAVSPAGDVNADGAPDLIVGAHQLFREGNGKAYLFHGPLTPGTISAAAANAVLLGEEPVVPEEEDLFGEVVASAGDVNGDGIDDVVVAASNNRAGGLRAGRSYIFYGPLSGHVPAANANRIVTGSSDDLLGNSLASVGDLNGDGADEVLIGAPGVFDTGVAEYAAVFFGQLATSGAPPPGLARDEAVLTPVLPNPTSGMARVALTVAHRQWVSMAVFDALGRRVTTLLEVLLEEHETRLVRLDFTSLRSGVYVVRAIGERFSVSRMMVVR